MVELLSRSSGALSKRGLSVHEFAAMKGRFRQKGREIENSRVIILRFTLGTRFSNSMARMV